MDKNKEDGVLERKNKSGSDIEQYLEKPVTRRRMMSFVLTKIALPTGIMIGVLPILKPTKATAGGCPTCDSGTDDTENCGGQSQACGWHSCTSDSCDPHACNTDSCSGVSNVCGNIDQCVSSDTGTSTQDSCDTHVCSTSDSHDNLSCDVDACAQTDVCEETDTCSVDCEQDNSCHCEMYVDDWWCY